MRVLRFVFAAAVLFGSAFGAAEAASVDYKVGDVVMYDNPNDDVPALKGRVTKTDADKIWVDFKEFQPELDIANGSKVLYRRTNAVDDWTLPADAAPAAEPVPAPKPQANLIKKNLTAAPPAMAALGDVFGDWHMMQVGHTTIQEPGDGFIYQTQERGAHSGVLTIRRNGTYTWNSVEQGKLEGKWRQVAVSELKGGYGPQGIKLMHGESGWDYNVQHRTPQSSNTPDSIILWLNGYQLTGYRLK